MMSFIIEILDFLRNPLDVLDGSVGPHKFLFEFLVPKPQPDQVLKKVFVDHYEFP